MLIAHLSIKKHLFEAVCVCLKAPPNIACRCQQLQKLRKNKIKLNLNVFLAAPGKIGVTLQIKHSLE
jgi:hypothetical protein